MTAAEERAVGHAHGGPEGLAHAAAPHEAPPAEPRVYLAGPPFAEEYRRRATRLLAAAGCTPLDPLRRDFRGRTEGREQEIVEGDVADIASCAAVLGDFTRPDEGTAMEAWLAHAQGIPVVAYTGGQRAHPWTVYVSIALHADLEDAVAAVVRAARRQAPEQAAARAATKPAR